MSDQATPSVDDLFLGSVTIGERGQIVIPAEARKACDLHTGDRLLVFRQPHKQGVGILMLAKIGQVQEFLEEMGQFLSQARARLNESSDTENE
jgi:AbrB family looped-hinge helix DNA binding protein